MTMSQKYDYQKIANFLTKDANPLKIRPTEDEALVVVISTGQKYAYTPAQVLAAHYAITPIPKKADPVKAVPAAKPASKPAANVPSPGKVPSLGKVPSSGKKPATKTASKK
jgi:hypothetical protein